MTARVDFFFYHHPHSSLPLPVRYVDNRHAYLCVLASKICMQMTCSAVEQEPSCSYVISLPHAMTPMMLQIGASLSIWISDSINQSNSQHPT